MTTRFRSPQTTTVAREVDLLTLLGEFVDASVDTVDLMTGNERTELEWLAQCDYLRALQRLGHETLAHHDHRMLHLRSPLVSTLKKTLARGWTATVPILRGAARAAQALPQRRSPDGARARLRRAEDGGRSFRP